MSRTIVFSDYFPSRGLPDARNWYPYLSKKSDSPFGRTLWGKECQARVIQDTLSGGNCLSLPLRTYNPDNKNTFLGTTLFAHSSKSHPQAQKYDFDLKHTAGKAYYEFTARLRIPMIRPGMIPAFFSYGPTGASRGDEIDFEFVNNLLVNQSLWLNVFRKSRTLGDASCSMRQNDSYNRGVNLSPLANIDWTQWNTYKIRWTKTQVVWLVKNPFNSTFIPVRTVNRYGPDPYPEDPMHVILQVWVPDANIFPQAYNANLRLGSRANNQTYSLLVKWVTVELCQ